MQEKQYKIRFLPLFEDDLTGIVDYISVKLKNPDAALNLLDDIQDAIRSRSYFAESFEPYPSLRERSHPYYAIYVKNYTVFYVVIDDVMEVRRILYSKSDTSKKIK